jgi:hypothetical protein
MISEFFIFCSGASKDVLKSCPKSETIKYSSIGATVFLTGMMAAVSGGYALYSVFNGINNAVVLSMLFGAFWGIIIFNLDRFIVASLRKEGNIRKELLYATPRLIIAILISLVIAKPLEVRIFANRIEQQILENKRLKLGEEKLSIDKLNDLSKLETKEDNQNIRLIELQKLKNTDPQTQEFSQLLLDLKYANDEYSKISVVNNLKISKYNTSIAEIVNNPANYEQEISENLLPQFARIKNEIIRSKSILINDIRIKQKKIADIESKINIARSEYDAQISKKIADNEVDIKQIKKNKNDAYIIAKKQEAEGAQVKEKAYTNNFITQVEALGNLNSKPFSTMWWTSYLLMLLFITIETAPVVVKLLSKRGPYDQILERIEYEHFIEQQRIISDKNDEINNLLIEIKQLNKLKGEVRLKTEKTRLDAELRANESLLNNIATKQASLAKIAIDQWYEDEYSRIKGGLNAQSYSQTIPNINQSTQSFTLIDTIWKASNHQNEVYYLFKNGKPVDNELEYKEDGITHIGTWDYVIPNKEIKITLQNNSNNYELRDISLSSVKLKSLTSNEEIELIK